MISNSSGKPVRFFVILMGGWVAVRLASGMIGPTIVKDAPPALLTPSRTIDGPDWPSLESAAAALIPDAAAFTTNVQRPPLAPLRLPLSLTKQTAKQPITFTSAPAPTPASENHSAASTPQITPSVALALPLTPSSNAAFQDRWRGSMWILWRDGSAPNVNAIPAGRLGGSQAGLRIDYDLTPQSTGRTALYGRMSVALNRPTSPEAAAGVGWQPLRAIPVTLAAERRISLGTGARNANALLAIGGFGPTKVMPGLHAEAYAQGGMVGFQSRDLFADGKLSLLSPVSKSPFKVGGSISGGAQPGVERLDIGPEVQLRLPLPQVAARMSFEWRGRVAGRATPSSGLAVTLGADF